MRERGLGGIDTYTYTQTNPVPGSSDLEHKSPRSEASLEQVGGQAPRQGLGGIDAPLHADAAVR